MDYPSIDRTGALPMKPVARSEVMDLGEYAQIREHFRKRIIEHKRQRRIGIGANLTAVFENHDTVLFQIQEMLRTERITREDAILHELETYNELIPAEGELSATIFVEYPDPAERDRMLVALDGLEKCFYLEVDGRRLPARSETRGVQPGKTTAVHYVKFPLTADAVAAVVNGKPEVAVGVDHAAYAARAVVPDGMLAELRADLGS
jgi:hypothetical protein